ncbi:MAG: TauD/TfdA family dioxygenase [Proteobacteria bacterium]|nr:TauD/TfdA family dioxygenase [Pseudomonadota bacterium]
MQLSRIADDMNGGGVLSMEISVSPVHGRFVAEVAGVDLSKPLDDDYFDHIHDAFLEHSILVFRGQALTNEQHIAFSRRFGELEIHTAKHWLLPDFPEILVLSNRGENGTRPIVNGGAYWHSDMTYMAKPPLGSVLYALEVPPEGGDTLYTDMYAAYETLDEKTKGRIENLEVIHRYGDRYQMMASDDNDRPPLTPEQLAEVPDVVHPMVRTHPETGRKALFVNEGFTVAIVELAKDEGEALLEKLFSHSVQPAHVYRHRWQAGDLVMWDNRCTMHRATEYDLRYDRAMHRTTIQGDRPA